MQKLVLSSTLQQPKSHPITQNLNLSDIVQTQATIETYNTSLYNYFLDTYFRLPFCKDTFITTNSSQADPRNEHIEFHSIVNQQKQNFSINDYLSLELHEMHLLNSEPLPPLYNLNIAFHHNQQPILILTYQPEFQFLESSQPTELSPSLLNDDQPLDYDDNNNIFFIFSSDDEKQPQRNHTIEESNEFDGVASNGGSNNEYDGQLSGYETNDNDYDATSTKETDSILQ